MNTKKKWLVYHRYFSHLNFSCKRMYTWDKSKSNGDCFCIYLTHAKLFEIFLLEIVFTWEREKTENFNKSVQITDKFHVRVCTIKSTFLKWDTKHVLLFTSDQLTCGINNEINLNFENCIMNCLYGKKKYVKNNNNKSHSKHDIFWISSHNRQTKHPW